VLRQVIPVLINVNNIGNVFHDAIVEAHENKTIPNLLSNESMISSNAVISTIAVIPSARS